MICIDAFKNLNIVYSDSKLSLSPCCISPTRTTDTIDFYNNQYLLGIRNSWKEGKFPRACAVCETKKSLRISGSNQWYADNNYNNTDVELIRLDYWTGDACNLRCIICGPENSSSWKQELDLPVQRAVVNKFWKTLDLTKLKFVHFNGGEPLLSKDHVEFLISIPNKNLAHINYNTNGTVLPSKRLLDLWAEFRIVQLDFSIDDIEGRFEYQRFPAKWDKVAENLQWFIDNCPINCMFAVNTAVGILNHANLDNLNTWLKTNFYTNRVTDPIEHRQQSVTGIFSLDGATTRSKSIVRFLDDCDARRGTDWRNTFPELSQLY
jgi:sulfatase maturation enzyme AslB (radical SAM superfamily)